MRKLLMIALLAVAAFAFGNPFDQINTSEWRMARQLVDDTDARRVSCPAYFGEAACFSWPMLMFQADDTIHAWLTEEAPSRHFIDAVSEWERESESELVRQYTHYTKDLLVYYNGRVLALILD